MSLKDECKKNKCKHLVDSSAKAGIPGKERYGNYCTKFQWNLDKVKNWKQKMSSIRTSISYPPMELIPVLCQEFFRKQTKQDLDDIVERLFNHKADQERTGWD